MREITFTGGIVSVRIREGVQSTEDHLARLVAQAQAAHRISWGVAPGLAAHIIFNMYRAEIRYCLDDEEPDVAGSMANLRQQFDVLFDGLAPRRGVAPDEAR